MGIKFSFPALPSPFSGRSEKAPQGTSNPPSTPAISSYQKQAETTQTYQAKRLASAEGRSTAEKLRQKAKTLINPRANANPAGFQATAPSWKAAASEITATFIVELKSRESKNFDEVALAKAIALIEHERDVLRSSSSSHPDAQEKVFPEVKNSDEALTAAIAELFKSVNQEDKQTQALNSFKYAEKGYLHEYEEQIAEHAGKAMTFLRQIAGADPTAKTVVMGLQGLFKASEAYLYFRTEGHKEYFSGAEELAPTVVPQLTPSVAEGKSLIGSARDTKYLKDANEVQASLADVIQRTQTFLEANKGVAVHSIQAMQKHMSTSQKGAGDLLGELQAAVVSGKRVLQAEADFKNASRKADITGAGKLETAANYSRKAAGLGGIIGVLCGDHLITPAVALSVRTLIQLAYHLEGAERDGETRLLKKLEAILKSDDLIDTSKISRRQIANLYAEYKTVADGTGSPAEKEAARQKLKQGLEGKINIGVVNSTLRSPVELRLEKAEKILEGQFAENLKRAQSLERDHKDGLLAMGDGMVLRDNARKELKQSLTDVMLLDKALKCIKEAMQNENDGEQEDALNAAYKQASQFFGEIRNKDFQQLFSGTLQEQMVSLNKASQYTLDPSLKKLADSNDEKPLKRKDSGYASLSESKLEKPAPAFAKEAGLEKELHNDASTEKRLERADSGYESLFEKEPEKTETIKPAPNFSRKIAPQKEVSKESTEDMDDKPSLKSYSTLDSNIDKIDLVLQEKDDKDEASLSAVHIGEDLIDRLTGHGAVPQGLSLKTQKTGSTEHFDQFDLDLETTTAYYKDQIKKKGFQGKSSEVWKGLKQKGKHFGEELFGAGARMWAVQKNMKSTREARHQLPDDIRAAEALMEELKAFKKNGLSYGKFKS